MTDSSLKIEPPFDVYSDLNGDPLANGKIFIGGLGLNPEINPIDVFWDDTFTSPAAQPIRTLAGYPSRNGTPANMYIDGTGYSITVRDKDDEFIYSELNVGEVIVIDELPSPTTVATIAELTAINTDFVTIETLLIVLGKFAVDDGGGGDFYWDSTSIATVDDGIIFASDAVGTGRWVRMVGEEYSLRWWLITPSGSDDTVVIQAAFDAIDGTGKTLIIPNYGTPLKSDEIVMEGFTNCTILWEPGSEIEYIQTGAIVEFLVRMDNVTNIHWIAYGAKFTGIADTIVNTPGEAANLGLAVRGCSGVWISGGEYTNYSDGLYVGVASSQANNWVIRDVKSIGNTRQGLSVVSCFNGRVLNSEFRNTSGAILFGPQAGIDVEPNSGNVIKRLIIDNCTTVGNAGAGINIAPSALNGQGNIFNLIINNFISREDNYGLILGNVENQSGTIQINNVSIFASNRAGITMAAWGLSGPSIIIDHPMIHDPCRGGLTTNDAENGIAFWNQSSSRNYDLGGITIINPWIQNTGATMQQYLYVDNAGSGNIKDMRIIDPIKLSGANSTLSVMTARYEVEVEDRFNEVISSNTITSHTYSTNGQTFFTTNTGAVSSRTLTLASNIVPKEQIFKFRVTASQALKVAPASPEIILGKTTAGQAYQSSLVGSELWIRKNDATTWVVVYETGTWVAV